MILTGLDVMVMLVYLVLILVVGLLFGGRAGRSLDEYFVSGRSLPWWIAGTSMVATTFAADTPLAVTGLVIKDGIAGNWVWWAYAVGGMLTVFLYARLWRRSRVITDVELVELRYSGPGASFLRGFRAVYLAVLMNCLIIGWVCNAMIKVLGVTLKPEETAMLAPFFERITAGINGTLGLALTEAAVSRVLMLLLLLAITGIFSAVSGMWGVSVTDFIMFWIAMLGCVILAVKAVGSVGGISGLKEGLNATYGSGHEVLNFVPNFKSSSPLMPLSAFFIFLAVVWWASWYPGAEPGGGGYVVQRMASCRNEKHSLLATLWFTIAHYGVRPWPWILVGLVAAVKFPELAQKGADADSGFPRVMAAVLTPGWRGLLLVSFFAAFMSTISTQINWGSSYVVNDFYKRFIRPDADPKHYTRFSRWCTLAILLIGTIISFWITSVADAWKLMLTIGAGTGIVFMLRWFWWRINAWSEISSMVSSLVIALFLIYGFRPMVSWLDWLQVILLAILVFAVIGVSAFLIISAHPRVARGVAVTAWSTIIVMALVVAAWLIYPVKLESHHHILVTAVSTILVWVSVTLLTEPVDEERLLAFYRLTRPGGPGWQPMRRKAPDVMADRNIGSSLLCWLLGVVVVYSMLFGVGKIVLGMALQGCGMILIGAVSAALMIFLMQKSGWEKVLK